ncbi:MAG TPA: DUF488 family protein [Candidatus Limnocylindria bacterium]
MSTRIAAKRVYEPASRADGTRILVDRLWPRGVRTEDASWQGWRKDLAPSDALRRWYGHDPARFAEFARRYEDELRDPGTRAAVRELLRTRGGRVTLVTATRELDLSGARVLASVMRRVDAALARRRA